MATQEITGRSVSMKLGNGYGANVQLMSVSIGTLSPSRYDATKAFAVARELSYAYNQVLVKVEETTKALLTS